MKKTRRSNTTSKRLSPRAAAQLKIIRKGFLRSNADGRRALLLSARSFGGL